MREGILKECGNGLVKVMEEGGEGVVWEVRDVEEKYYGVKYVMRRGEGRGVVKRGVWWRMEEVVNSGGWWLLVMEVSKE